MSQPKGDNGVGLLDAFTAMCDKLRDEFYSKIADLEYKINKVDQDSISRD